MQELQESGSREIKFRRRITRSKPSGGPTTHIRQVNIGIPQYWTAVQGDIQFHLVSQIFRTTLEHQISVEINSCRVAMFKCWMFAASRPLNGWIRCQSRCQDAKWDAVDIFCGEPTSPRLHQIRWPGNWNRLFWVIFNVIGMIGLRCCLTCLRVETTCK